jgi:uncharacterized phage protein (TIGR01671 family)
MRKILFRAKSKDDCEWIFGGYYHMTEYYGDPCDKHVIIMSNDDLEDNMMRWEYVCPNTVGQYTGSKDLNGNMIFEGDIVKKRSNGRIAVVEWDNGSWILSNWTDEMFDYDFLSNWCSDHSYHGENIGGCTVIGNVHDDYNLLISEDKTND